MKRLIVPALVLAAGCMNSVPAPPKAPLAPPVTTPVAAPAEVELRVVKLPQLQEGIAALKGKVVVVDVWATFCRPCMTEFPHLVELHEKYGKDGLACVSVTVDDAADKDKALAFLKKQKALFPNYLIDESTEDWQTKLDIGNPPQVIVFDRDGKRVKKFASDDPPFNYDVIEKFVAPLLKK